MADCSLRGFGLTPERLCSRECRFMTLLDVRRLCGIRRELRRCRVWKYSLNGGLSPSGQKYCDEMVSTVHAERRGRLPGRSGDKGEHASDLEHDLVLPVLSHAQQIDFVFAAENSRRTVTLHSGGGESNILQHPIAATLEFVAAVSKRVSAEVDAG